MKKLILLAIVALALPISAMANSVTFSTQGGNAWVGSNLSTSSSSGFTTPGRINVVKGLGGHNYTGLNLGKLTFSTGALTSGSLASGGSFAGGGSFTMSLNGSVKGMPNATVFQGSFNGPVVWSNLGHGYYSLSGTIVGIYNGRKVTGGVTVLFAGGIKNGHITMSGATVNIPLPVPEPGTLSMLGTGLLGLAGLVRRKFRIV